MSSPKLIMRGGFIDSSVRVSSCRAIGTRSPICLNVCPNDFGTFVRMPRGGASKNRTYDLVIISDAL